jgi:hypothetical protein
MKQEEFERICKELNGVFMKSKDGSVKCVFPANTTSIKVENIKLRF